MASLTSPMGALSGLWTMSLTTLMLMLAAVAGLVSADQAEQHRLGGSGATGFQAQRAAACPNYLHYAGQSHPPLSTGRLGLPYQRPASVCRTFRSALVEQVIADMTARLTDPDMARLFENAYPNTLDTTVQWHIDGSSPDASKASKSPAWRGAQSFIVTGDINAEWLRDSANQLQGYMTLAAHEPALAALIRGAINTQAEFVIASPYCNAFQPPPPSGLAPTGNGQNDFVHPAYEQHAVFECKYEIDSLAHFLRLGNEFHAATGETDFVTNDRWLVALNSLLAVLDAQARPAFDEQTGQFQENEYTFRRMTTAGTETLALGGLGNPAAGQTGLIRSAFRPSDDATILPFFIPGNAMMSVELGRAAKILEQAGRTKLAASLTQRAKIIRDGIFEYGVTEHKKYGKVFAFETDGYGSHILMDDANLPSLLALPWLGFVDKDDEIYQNTRKMILNRRSNPYYLSGRQFSGIGGPHIGLRHAWPMSKLFRAMTTDNDTEIEENLIEVLESSKMGLIHESVNVKNVRDYTRPWFAWANSVFAQTILHLAAEKPHIIFGAGAKPYRLEDVKLEK